MSNPEPEASSPFLSDFLDDYFAECDEHLTIIRRNLLALDSFVNQPRIDRSPVDELFRGFHTLKGVSGMMGVAEAERLAHQIESYLRILRDNNAPLTVQGMDALVSGTSLMEHIIAERRGQGRPTDIGEVMSQIAEATINTTAFDPPSSHTSPSRATGALSAEDASKLALAIESGKKIWTFEFVPLPELARRGINVNVIRERLQAIGEMLLAAPRIMPHGGIAFEFVVASSADQAWRLPRG